MKCLTIRNPYPVLMFLPADDIRVKLIENRTWSTPYRGDLLIHAGKSDRDVDYDLSRRSDLTWRIPVRDMKFGMIVGVVKLLSVIPVCNVPFPKVYNPKYHRVFDDRVPAEFDWIKTHQHALGPYCWVISERRRFPRPIYYTGAQGIFEVPDEVVAEQMTQAVAI